MLRDAISKYYGYEYLVHVLLDFLYIYLYLYIYMIFYVYLHKDIIYFLLHNGTVFIVTKGLITNVLSSDNNDFPMRCHSICAFQAIANSWGKIVMVINKTFSRLTNQTAKRLSTIVLP